MIVDPHGLHFPKSALMDRQTMQNTTHVKPTCKQFIGMGKTRRMHFSHTLVRQALLQKLFSQRIFHRWCSISICGQCLLGDSFVPLLNGLALDQEGTKCILERRLSLTFHHLRGFFCNLRISTFEMRQFYICVHPTTRALRHHPRRVLRGFECTLHVSC